MIRQMTLDEALEKRWCKTHRCYDCTAHGRKGYTWLPDEIMRAMHKMAQEREELENKIVPMYPHDVWVYMEGMLPHIQTMRKYMKRLVAEGELVRIGVRGGYLLPQYAQVS